MHSYCALYFLTENQGWLRFKGGGDLEKLFTEWAEFDLGILNEWNIIANKELCPIACVELNPLSPSAHSSEGKLVYYRDATPDMLYELMKKPLVQGRKAE